MGPIIRHDRGQRLAPENYNHEGRGRLPLPLCEYEGGFAMRRRVFAILSALLMGVLCAVPALAAGDAPGEIAPEALAPVRLELSEAYELLIPDRICYAIPADLLSSEQVNAHLPEFCSVRHYSLGDGHSLSVSVQFDGRLTSVGDRDQHIPYAIWVGGEQIHSGDVIWTSADGTDAVSGQILFGRADITAIGECFDVLTYQAAVG